MKRVILDFLSEMRLSVQFSTFSFIYNSRSLFLCIMWTGVNCREFLLLRCTFAMSNWILDTDNSKANDLSLQNVVSILSHNVEIFHESVSSFSCMGSITIVWNHSWLIDSVMKFYGITFLFKGSSFSLFNSDLFNGCNVLWQNPFSVVISILKFSN